MRWNFLCRVRLQRRRTKFSQQQRFTASTGGEPLRPPARKGPFGFSTRSPGAELKTSFCSSASTSRTSWASSLEHEHLQLLSRAVPGGFYGLGSGPSGPPPPCPVLTRPSRCPSCGTALCRRTAGPAATRTRPEPSSGRSSPGSWRPGSTRPGSGSWSRRRTDPGQTSPTRVRAEGNKLQATGPTRLADRS